MKNKILLILLLAPFMIQAQQSKPFGSYDYLRTAQTNQQHKEKLNHASAKLLDDTYFLTADRSDTFSFINSTWSSVDSSQYLYNLQDSTLSVYNRVVNDPDSGWVSNLATYYYYDADKNDTAEINQSYDLVNEVWINETRSTYNYDLNGNVIHNTKYSWDIPSSSWVRTNEYLWDYDGNFNLIKFTLLDWVVSSGDTSFQFVYTYDLNNNLSTATLYQWLPDKLPYDQVTHYYNALNQDTVDIDKYWNTNSNSWKNNALDTLVYDASGNLLSSTIFSWKNSAQAFILTYFKTEYTYDLTNKLIGREDYFGDGASSFIPALLRSYQYDINDNLTYELLQSYNSGTLSFDNSEQTFYYYSDFLSGIHPSPEYLEDLSLYPNPADQSLVLHLQSEKDENLQMKIFDQAGRLLQSNRYSVKSGDNKYLLDVSGFDSGIYLIEFANGNNQTVTVQRFVKQ